VSNLIQERQEILQHLGKYLSYHIYKLTQERKLLTSGGTNQTSAKIETHPFPQPP